MNKEINQVKNECDHASKQLLQLSLHKLTKCFLYLQLKQEVGRYSQ